MKAINYEYFRPGKKGNRIVKRMNIILSTYIGEKFSMSIRKISNFIL